MAVALYSLLPILLGRVSRLSPIVLTFASASRALCYPRSCRTSLGA